MHTNLSINKFQTFSSESWFGAPKDLMLIEIWWKRLFKNSFIPKIMILPFLTQKVTHVWQGISICCKSSAYEQAKLVKCFQFYYVLLKREKKNQISIYVFFNQFSMSTWKPDQTGLQVNISFWRFIFLTHFHIRSRQLKIGISDINMKFTWFDISSPTGKLKALLTIFNNCFVYAHFSAFKWETVY